MVLNQDCTSACWTVHLYLGANTVGCAVLQDLARAPSAGPSLNFPVWPRLETIEVGQASLAVEKDRNSDLRAC